MDIRIWRGSAHLECVGPLARRDGKAQVHEGFKGRGLSTANTTDNSAPIHALRGEGGREVTLVHIPREEGGALP